MYKYLTISKTKNKLYYKTNNGICESTILYDRLTDSKIILNDIKESFFVYKDSKNTHMIAVSNENELIYMTLKNNKWQKFIISKLNPKIEIKKIMIGVSNSRQNLFYSAKYEEEFILVHCILGNNALPETIDKLSDENFFVNGDFVYYSNQNKDICKQDFSDGKPCIFTRISNGNMPYIANINENRYLISKRDNDILINNKIITTDLYSEFPILQHDNDILVLLWKSGDFLKYLPINKEKPQKPLRYLSGNNPPEIFILSDGVFTKYFYGTLFNNSIRFFPKLNLSDYESNLLENNIFLMKSSKINELNKMISDLKKDVGIYKSQVNKLKLIINKMKNEN